MEPDKPSRGRARGRSRLSATDAFAPEGSVPENSSSSSSTSPPAAMDTSIPREQMEYRVQPGVLPSDGEDSGSPGSNGNGNRGSGSSGSPNGSDGNGNGGHHSDEDIAPGQVRGRVVTGSRMEQSEYLTTRPPNKNKKGSYGEFRKYFANYFVLQTKKNLMMRLYEVKFHPELDDLKIRKALLRTKEEEVGPYIFDGRQLFTTRELPEESLNLSVFFPDKPDKVYAVNLRFIRNGGTLESGATQLYNLIIRKAQVGMNLVQLGRHFFDARERINIHQYRLELWPGYITSMRQMEGEILLNVDLTFKVCRTDNVLQCMREIRSRDPNNYRRICEETIVGTIVMTSYNQKTYRVDAIDWDMKPRDTFSVTKKGETRDVSFVEYYKSKNYEIKELGQPMIISHATKRDIRRGDNGDKILVPEMCYQTGLNDDMRGNFRLMKDLSQHLHMQPTERLKKTVRFMKNMGEIDNIRLEMERWGMRFRTEPVEVEGRMLPPEDIVFNRQSFKSNEQADWSLAFRSQKMLLSMELRKWVLFFTNRDSQNIQNLIQTMQKVATPLGYMIQNPERVTLPDGKPRTFTDAIDSSVQKHNGQLDMMMVILPTNKLELYAVVKKNCSIKYGIPSQCFQAKNLSKNLMSICTKLVIQMNAKQGGQPWSVNSPLKNIMVVGFDVHHAKGMKSFGAMTATMGNNLSSYYSTINEQLSGVEMCEQMGASFRKCLKAFYEANSRKLPERIMFYRDGVGEGQLNFVYQSEVKAVREVIQATYNKFLAELPKFAMIVVTKRINTRIFESRSNGQFANPQPGTVVDDRITCPEKYDFYLVPQTARQGTVSPVAFNIIWDESGLDADKLQRFTFKLCHLYYNWSGTVAVPAPCQYAHKLAFLTGTALHGAVNDRLSNLLHFL